MDRANLISSGWCVSIAVRLKRLRASVHFTCPFQTHLCQIQTGELHPPANERPPFGTEVKERPAVTKASNSRVARFSSPFGTEVKKKKRPMVTKASNSRVLKLNTSTFPLLTCQFCLYCVAASAFKTDGQVRPHEVQTVLVIHTAGAAHVSAFSDKSL